MVGVHDELLGQQSWAYVQCIAIAHAQETNCQRQPWPAEPAEVL